MGEPQTPQNGLDLAVNYKDDCLSLLRISPSSSPPPPPPPPHVSPSLLKAHNEQFNSPQILPQNSGQNS